MLQRLSGAVVLGCKGNNLSKSAGESCWTRPKSGMFGFISLDIAVRCTVHVYGICGIPMMNSGQKRGNNKKRKRDVKRNMKTVKWNL
jgi:hypothetical protein